MKCDELEEEYLWTNNVKTPSTRMVRVYNADEVDAAIAELKQKLEDVQASMYCDVVDANMDNRRLKRALWLMTAEWAEGMGLASCNIAIKLSVKERFYYHDEANREKDIKKYRHRQVVFYKYADYCRKKAEASK